MRSIKACILKILYHLRMKEKYQNETELIKIKRYFKKLNFYQELFNEKENYQNCEIIIILIKVPRK